MEVLGILYTIVAYETNLPPTKITPGFALYAVFRELLIMSCLKLSLCVKGHSLVCRGIYSFRCLLTLGAGSRPVHHTASEKKLKWSFTHGVSQHPLLGVTIGNQLQIQTEKHPDREAVVCFQDGERLTFADLLRQADRLAAGLLSLGLKKGDRVGMLGPNSREWVITQYATARAGLILVDCKALVSDVSFRDIDYYEILYDLIPELASCTPGNIRSHMLPDLKALIMLGKEKFRGAYNFHDILDAAGSSEVKAITDLQNTLQFDDPVNIQFTSGTTGVPKGATLSHHSILNNSYFMGMRMDYHNRETRLCCTVPLYHCFGMVAGCLQIPAHGATVVLPSRGFNAGITLKAVEEEKCTSLYGVPTMFIDMLNHKDLEKFDLSTLYTGIVGGSCCPIEIMQRVISKMHMNEVTVCYGSTETSPTTFQSLSNSPIEKRVTTVGRVSDHVEAKIVDENGNIVPVGTVGQLCTRGYTTMLGYWKDTTKTAEVLKQDRWYYTGDQGVMDEEGYCRITGRLKDMVIKGGENIYPLEIEQILYEHPKIKDVQVIGVPDARLGEELCAWVQLKSGQTATDTELKEFCKKKLAKFKVPRYIQFVDVFPMTVTGKIQKFKMREESMKLLKLEHIHPH